MYSRILVPVDGSETSTLGLREAIKLAREQQARLRIVHVVSEPIGLPPDGLGFYASSLYETLQESGKAIVKDAEKTARDQGVQAETVVLEAAGQPAGDVIVQQASEWPADLIVIGTHGRRGMRRLVLGSDAEHIVRLAPVPVLLVRHPGRTSGSAAR